MLSLDLMKKLVQGNKGVEKLCIAEKNTGRNILQLNICERLRGPRVQHLKYYVRQYKNA